MVTVKSIFAAALAVLPAAKATQSFYNDGHLNGWDYVRRENQGTVSEVSNVVYKGTSALKMTQTYTPGYTGRYHSEVDHNRGYQRGEELFYGFMFRLSEQWEPSSQSYNIAQFIANRQGAGCGDDDWMPSTMVWIQNSQLYTRYVNGHYRQPNCGRSILTQPNLAPVSAGQWHKVILQIKWASDKTGFFKVWFDGNKVYEEYNIATTVDDDSVFQFRVGLYANSWHDDHQMTGSQAFRQVWYDEIAIGTTFADVDPDQA
ncbi:hypothetical protein Trco_000218 [Trichoderma cornu-damae]|uniref:Polysaccharide lyase family 20 protein n=1 Tax=Trichoderma cornu-damae TaxID=654480 RepID=A0A9P8QWU0_9HYPO|nr:hypothetical protein Trco_000218 [Trichoderma cornu-damae]